MIQRAAIAFLVLCLSTIIVLGGDKSQVNKYVDVDVTLSGTVVRPGAEGRILVAFDPIDGIHINADPPVDVRLAKSKAVRLQGSPDFSIDKESGFLSTSTPVEQRFIVSPKAKPGELIVKGTIVYYFCSDTEGWCRRFSQPVTLKFNIQNQ